MASTTGKTNPQYRPASRRPMPRNAPSGKPARPSREPVPKERYLCEHGLVIRIEAFLIHVQVLAEVYAAGEVQVERCSLEYERGVVSHSAQTMLVTNAGSTAAAYDTPAERTSNFLFTDKHNVFLLSLICKKCLILFLYC